MYVDKCFVFHVYMKFCTKCVVTNDLVDVWYGAGLALVRLRVSIPATVLMPTQHAIPSGVG